MENIEGKLVSYFNGDTDENTNEAVERWISESAENEKTAVQVGYICAAADSIKALGKIDTEDALGKMHKRINAGRRNEIFRRFVNAAAVLLLPVMLAGGYFMYEFFHIDESEYVHIKATSGMIASVTLPDGSSVWLNSNSSLKYPSRFVGRTRNVELDGEGYFKVSADPERKFIVHTKAMQIEVFGTEFNVDAYDEYNRDARTTLISGKVQMRYFYGDGDSQVVKMRAGNMLIFNPETMDIRMSEADHDVVSSWKDGKIVLHNTKLEDALRMIENRYHVEFDIKNEELLDNRYTGQFSGHSLDVVLEHFKRTTNISIVRGEVLEGGMEIITIY